MKKLFPSLLLLILFSLSANAALVELSHTCFKAADQQYIELNLWLASNSVAHKKISTTQYQASVEVTIIFYAADVIKQFDKFILNGPSTLIPVDFRDVKRYRLPKGEYKYEVKITDVHQPEVNFHFEKNFVLDLGAPTLSQSGIQLLSNVEVSQDTLSSFVKNGVMMEPLIGNFYTKMSPKLICYHEIYNADKSIGDDFMVRYLILQNINGTIKERLVGHKRQKAKGTNPLLLKMDIRDLASGQFTFVIEVRNRLNKLLSKKSIDFTRANPNLNITRSQISAEELKSSFVIKLDEAEMRYSLKALASRIQNDEVILLNKIIAAEQREDKERFLLSFFLSLDPNKPQEAYQNYMTFVKQVDEEFRSGLGYGFETDRGHVFMKYGRPDDMVSIENEPDAPPYEIWIYYDFPSTRQTNVKFLFYNPNLTVGAYELLHSTAVGEIQNPQWQLDLYKKIPNEIDGNNYFDATSVKQGINRRAAEYFSDF